METSIFWFRRDLRLHDNAGLFKALSAEQNVLPIFIFDRDILDQLNHQNDARVSFIYDAVSAIKAELKANGSDLLVLHGSAVDCWSELLKQYKITAVYCNEDYEPSAIARDQSIQHFLAQHSIPFKTFKDHCIFRYDEVLKDDGKPYTVFTPYAKKWKQRLQTQPIETFPSEKHLTQLTKAYSFEMLSIESMGFTKHTRVFPGKTVQMGLIKQYDQNRNFPGIEGTSKLSVHFRFGTISIREKALKAISLSETWLNELIWRDFYIQIMAHFPHAMTSAFKPEYNLIEWLNDEQAFQAWCKGQTGYPIVDAGMRELNTTGFMHNRVRMIVSSFLCKHLLIDWRWGEAYFAEQLNDFELASNNGGWQWAAGSGVDAAPYFRIFNPSLQTERFDPKQIYIQNWLGKDYLKQYPKPIVEHTFARNRCLDVYKSGLAKSRL